MDISPKFINFRGAIINLSHFEYAIIEHNVMDSKDTTWSLRVHLTYERGFRLNYDLESEVKAAYAELCDILIEASSPSRT